MRKELTLFVLAGGLIVSGNTFAQQKKQYSNLNDTVVSIDEVVVSSERKKMNVLKLEAPAKFLPVSTNSLNGKVLENRGITDIQTASRFLPGVRIQTTYGAFQQISVRGFDHSVIMVDGVRDERSSIDNSYPFMDLTSIESIEVLKGPASVLYGQSAVGGVINVVRKAPSEKNMLNARVAYGSWYNMQATASMGGKLAGPINYLASFNYQNTDGWRDNKQQRLSGYLALGGQLTEKDMIDVRISGNRDFYSTEIGLPPTMTRTIYKASNNEEYLHSGDMLPGLDREARYNSESDFMYNRSFSVSATYKHEFSSAAKLTERFSYSYDDIDYFGTEELSYLTSNEAIYDYYYLGSDNSKTYICLDSIYYNYPLRFSHIAKTYNNQLELNGAFYTGNVKHNYLTGYSLIALRRVSYTGYLFGSSGDDVTGPGLTGHGSVYNPHSIGWMDTKFSRANPSNRWMHGFYLQDLVEFNDQLKWLLAGRYDLYSYRRTTNLPTIDGQRKFEDIPSSEYNKIKNHAFTFRTGLVYLPTEQFSVYGSFGTYFKPINTFYSATTIYIDKDGKEYNPEDGGEVFKPQSGYQLELGVRYELGERLQANASVYYINKRNMTRTLASVGDVVNGETLDKSVVGQVGRMDSRGFDIDVTYCPIAGMSLTAAYGFTNAKTREMADNPYMSSDSSKGKQFSYIPKNTFSAYGDYLVQKGFLRGLGVNLSVSFQDKVYRNTSNTTYFDSYWLTDLGLSYTLKNHVRIGLNINNLFDKEYYNQSLGNQMVPSMPRNFLVSASYTL
ncbi:MAG: TonB-dependent receptor [Bacteroides sp.]|nr:TonB-dependent receptor [Bacteroides sp.]